MRTVINIVIGKEPPFVRLSRAMKLDILPRAEDEFYIDTTAKDGGDGSGKTIGLEVSGAPCFVAEFFGGIHAEIILRVESVEPDELAALKEIGWVQP